VRNLIQMRRQEAELQEARLRLVEAERWALESELTYARQIQASILPREPVVHLPGLSVSAFLISASSCSGDFWFYRKLSDQRLLVVLGDVMGHGAGSAMITELAYGALNAFVRAHHDLTPSHVLGEMNQLLRDSTTLWMSMAIGLLDPAARRACWSSAGLPPILCGRPGGRVDLLENRSAPLGCSQDAEFVDHHVSIEACTRFLVYSDGIIEAKNERGRVFGRRQLLRSFEKSEPPACNGVFNSDWLAAIRSDFEKFARKTFDDDITAVAISMTPGP
jgi:sigma-B regulation protein RsbU (phosphoserine phosphatase)